MSVEQGKLRILVVMCAYWPGHEATGPNQSLRQMCAALHGRFEFRILSRDRPFGARAATAPNGQWVDQGFAKVLYTPVEPTGPVNLRSIISSTPHDVLWLNGFHDREFTLPTLMLRRIGAIARRPTILSTRGELAEGALGLKSLRKSAYRAIARRFGLVSEVWLHATGEIEARDNQRWFPWSKGVVIASNLRALVDPPASALRNFAAGGPLRIVVVGRIARVKNVAFAIKVLARVTVPVELELVGPIEELDYWRECETLIAQLPPHVSVRALGAISNAQIPECVAAADLFFSPTLGENFGHAIFEALSCGVPVLISDRTPWKGLAASSAGWELPLGDPAVFAAQIDALARLPLAERMKWREGARRLAERFVAHSDAAAATEHMLQTAMRGAVERQAA